MDLIESAVKVLSEWQESNLSESEHRNVVFKTGHYVVKDGPAKYIGMNKIYSKIYGQVTKHSPNKATVKWENGTESQHRHDGHSYGDRSGTLHSRIGHVHVGEPENVEHVKKHKEEHKNSVSRAEGEHKRQLDHQDIMNKLNSHHYSHLEPHHIQALETIHNEIEKNKNKIR